MGVIMCLQGVGPDPHWLSIDDLHSLDYSVPKSCLIARKALEKKEKEMVVAASVVKYVSIISFGKSRNQEGSFHLPTQETTSSIHSWIPAWKKPFCI